MKTGGMHNETYRISMALADPGNVLYHSRYLDLYHDARDRYMEAAGYGYGRLMMEGFHLAVVDTHLQFRMPAFYLETVEIHTRVSQIRSRSLQFAQTMTKRIGEDELTINEATYALVCIDLKGRPNPLPEALKAAIYAFQPGLGASA